MNCLLNKTSVWVNGVFVKVWNLPISAKGNGFLHSFSWCWKKKKENVKTVVTCPQEQLLKKNKAQANVNVSAAYRFPFTIRGMISICSLLFIPEWLSKAQQHHVASLCTFTYIHHFIWAVYQMEMWSKVFFRFFYGWFTFRYTVDINTVHTPKNVKRSDRVSQISH